MFHQFRRGDCAFSRPSSTLVVFRQRFRSAFEEEERSGLMMRRGGSHAARGLLLMRFKDKPQPPKVNFKPLPKSCEPVDLPADYVPHPLPLRDESFGFGPTRMSEVPDVLKAQRALEEEIKRHAMPTTTMTLEDDAAARQHLDSEGALTSQAEVDDALAREADKPVVPLAGPTEHWSYGRLALAPRAAYMKEAKEHSDRLVCTLTPKQLLERFIDRQTREEHRWSMIADIYQTIDRWTNEELIDAFDLIASRLEAGAPMQFLQVFTFKFATWTPKVGQELHFMYRLFDAIEHEVCARNPQRFVADPYFAARVLHFEGHVQVRDKQGHYTFDWRRPHTLRHTSGMVQHVDQVEHGKTLLEFAEEMLSEPWNAENAKNYSVDEIADLFSGYVAASMAGKVSNKVVRSVLDNIFSRPAHEVTDKAVSALVLSASLVPFVDDRLLARAYSCQEVTPELLVGLSSLRPLNPKGILELYERGLRSADERGKIARERVFGDPSIMEHQHGDIKKLAQDVFDAQRNLTTAFAEALKQFRCKATLKSATLKRRLNTCQSGRETLLGDYAENEVLVDGPRGPGETTLKIAPRTSSMDVNPVAVCHQYDFDKKLLRDALTTDDVGAMMAEEGFNSFPKELKSGRIAAWDKAFLFHSSACKEHLGNVIQLMSSMDGGKVGCVITTETLRRIHQRGISHADPDVRAVNKAALEILALELTSPDSNVVLMPFSSELAVVGDGDWYEEDSLTWLLAAHFLEAIPSVTPTILCDEKDPVSRPWPHFNLNRFGYREGFFYRALEVDYTVNLHLEAQGVTDDGSVLQMEKDFITQHSALRSRVQMADFGRLQFQRQTSKINSYSKSIQWRTATRCDANWKPKHLAGGRAVGTAENHARGATDHNYVGTGIHAGDSAHEAIL